MMYSEFVSSVHITKGIESEIRDKLKNHNISNMFHITACFDQYRFHGAQWSISPGRTRQEKVDAIIPELTFHFRRFYIDGILRNSSFDYRRGRTLSRQPLLNGFVHDDEMKSARPHLHCICVSTDPSATAWLRGSEPEALWGRLEPKGVLHIREFPPSELERVNEYGATYFKSRSTKGICDHLHFRFPDINTH